MAETYRSPSRSIEIDTSYGERGASCESPTHRLLVAIVRRALWDFVLYRGCDPAVDAERHRLAEDAAGWLFWDGAEETADDNRYTFLYICGILNLEPDKIRKAALRLTRNDIERMSNNIKDD